MGNHLYEIRGLGCHRSAECVALGAVSAQQLASSWINGAFVSTAGPSFDVINPATGAVAATYTLATVADVDAAVAAARAAQAGWAAATPVDRAGVLAKLAELMEAEADTFIAEEVAQCGKPVRLATEFDVPGSNVTEPLGQLLLRSGFGLYIGARAPAQRSAPAGALPGGEVEIYYDHRRDGLAGGIKTLGPNSGFAGHVGLRGEYYPTAAWGMNAIIERGSTWVLGSAVSFRTGLP